ncbi:serine/threonine-protein kinase [Amycolatopsis sp. NPDC059021]|uniref:serine/threonine-protein kinase n=1 Tax=Amycolatopsis sp. NPDC059021 TaxID=3346704 RepID=UPI00366A7155
MSEVGRQIANRYRLLEIIGSGGMGVVWRAYDRKLCRMVAVKRAKLPDSGSGRQLLREARLAARLQHPNVVTIHDAVVSDDDLWLVMEWVPAFTLAEMLEHGPLPARTVIEIGLQLADALEAVHEQGIVHRDVKPGNVLVTALGVIKLTDFGISRSVLTDDTITPSAMVSGSPGYIAPEVADGGEPTRAADIFGLGATLYAAVEGAPPFDGASPCAVLRKTAAGKVPPPRHAGELGRALATLMPRDPRERPAARGVRPLLTACRDGIPCAGKEKARATAEARREKSFRGPFRRGIQAAAVTAVAAPILVAAVAVDPEDAEGVGSPPAAADVPGDTGLRVTDLCALIDPGRREQITPTAVPGHGGINRCEIVVEPAIGEQLERKAEPLDQPTAAALPAGNDREPDAGVGGHDPGGCRLEIVLRFQGGPNDALLTRTVVVLTSAPRLSGPRCAQVTALVSPGPAVSSPAPVSWPRW